LTISLYQYGQNSSVSVAQVGWQADPNVGDFDVPNIGPLPPQNFAVEFYIAGPASVTATGGTPQSTVINTAFASSLQVTVRDLGSNSVAGVTVNFAVPGGAASATLSAASAVTNSSGVASVTATANATAGSYSVTASVVGVATPATFSLTNAAGAAVNVPTLSNWGLLALPLLLLILSCYADCRSRSPQRTGHEEVPVDRLQPRRGETHD
jgi:Bacterial Ig-like domain (group 1)